MGSKRCCRISNAASTHETGTDGNLRTGRYQYHAGAVRIALFTKNIDEEYERLIAVFT
jgi:hypothetical protein